MKYAIFILEKELQNLTLALESWSVQSRSDYSEIWSNHQTKLKELKQAIQKLKENGS